MWLDFMGASLSLICTYYFAQAKRIAWLIGLFAVICNVILYWQKEIYCSILLEIIYFVLMIIGWFQWSSSKKEVPIIRELTFFQGTAYSIIATFAIFLMGQIFERFTQTNIPYWDAVIIILSLIAQWLLCLKIIHCWVLWLCVDVILAILQYYKGIPFHSFVHFLYLILAIVGYYRWQKIYQKQIQLAY